MNLCVCVCLVLQDCAILCDYSTDRVPSAMTVTYMVLCDHSPHLN